MATVQKTMPVSPPRKPIQVPADLTLPDSILTDSALDDLALANRPELRGAEREIERAEITHELAERNRKYPDFMLGWDYMRMPTDMKKDRYGAMVNITIPFSPWTAGRTQLRSRRSLARSRARANRDAMRTGLSEKCRSRKRKSKPRGDR